MAEENDNSTLSLKEVLADIKKVISGKPEESAVQNDESEEEIFNLSDRNEIEAAEEAAEEATKPEEKAKEELEYQDIISDEDKKTNQDKNQPRP